VRARRKRPAGSPSIASILVPIDFSKHSESALAYAIPLARQFGAKLTVLHVIEPIPTADFDAAFPIALENEKSKELCEGLLTNTARKLAIEPELLERKLVRFGRPYNEIADAARTLKVDLIVIATHGYTGLKHTLMGSTAERVVRHAPCPVLVVRGQPRNLGRLTKQSSNGRPA
jgi:nucleotide-binding universal stress UspA family protein